MKLGLLILGLLGASTLSACTSTGTNFGLPSGLLSAPLAGSIDEVSSSIRSRQTEYVKAAQGAINGPQLFDVPAILAATAGVGSAAFELDNDLAPSAGTLAAGMLGFRGYYASGGRYPAYVAGARALSCLDQAALRVSGIDDVRAEWAALLIEAPGSGSEQANTVLRIGRSVVTAPRRLASAAMRVDSEVMRKLSAPTAPDLSTYMRNYQAAAGRAEDGENDTKSALFNLEQKDGTSSDFETRAAAQLGRADLIPLVNALDVEIEQCVALAV